MAYPDYTPTELPPPRASLLGRAGQQAANAPSSLLNSLLHLQYNLGLRTADQQGPVEVPEPYDIAPPQTLGEGAVDIGAGLAESLPLFMTGEGAGVGMAKLTRLGPVATRMARMAGGFGLADLAESPKQGAEGAAVGGLMGLAESVPGWPARIAATLGLGGATYLTSKEAGASDTQAGTQAGINMLLSRLFGAKVKKPAIPSEGGNAATGPKGPFLTYPDILQGRVLPKDAPYGGELPGRPLALEGGNRFPTLEGEFEKQLSLEGPVAPLQLENGIPVPPPAPVTRQVSPAPPPKMTLPELLQLFGAQENAQPPIPPRPPTPPIPPVPPTPPRRPFPPRQPGESLMTDMEQMQGSGYNSQPPESVIPEATAPVPPSDTKPKRVLLRDTLSPENAHQAAEKLGVEFTGMWPTGHVEFRFPPSDIEPTDRANFTLDPGATLKDLKNAIKDRKAKFKANPPADWLERQRALKGEGEGSSFTKTSKPSSEVATLQPSIKRLPNFETEGKYEVKIGEQTYHIYRDPESGMWFDANAPATSNHFEGFLGYTKKEALAKIESVGVEVEPKVATLQLENKAAASGPSSLETVPENPLARRGEPGYIPTTEAIRRAKELVGPEEFARQAEDRASQASSEGTRAIAIERAARKIIAKDLHAKGKLPPAPEGHRLMTEILAETDTGVEGQLAKLKVAGRDAIPRLSDSSAPPLEKAFETNAGDMADLENLGTKPQDGKLKTGGGTKRKSNFGEHAFTIPENFEGLAKYILGPAVGGLTGAAMADKDNRGVGFMTGMLAGGFGMHYLFKLAKMTAHGHDIRTPKVEVKTAIGTTTKGGNVSAEKVFDWAKSETIDGLKAIFGDEATAREAARLGGMADGWQRFSRWVSDNFKTEWSLLRVFQRADGLVNEQLENVRNNIKAVINHKEFKADETIRAAVRRFIEDGNVAKLDSLVSNPEIKQLAISAKASVRLLSEVFAGGLKDGKIKDKVMETLDTYLTRSYRAFETPEKFKPNQEKVVKAAISIQDQFPDMDLGQVVNVVRSYLEDIRAGKQFGRSLEGVSIGSGLTELKHLTPEFREMLDPIKDPLERILFTSMKLGHAARSAAFFDEVARMEKPNGLKWAYSSAEHQAIVATLQQQAMHGTEAVRLEAISKLQEAFEYVYQPEDVRAGRLAGQWVDPKLRAQIVDYGTSAQTFSNPLINAIAKSTNLIKYNKIILNPLQFARQFVQLPILGMMARTSMSDWIAAAKILHERGAEFHRLQREGVLAGDIIQGMIRKDARYMVTGALDAKLGAALSNGLHRFEELWRMPDLIVRASAFLKKERELMEKAGLSKPTREMTNKAIDHMNRYTMNYAAVAPFVRKARQLPFLNQYLSWTAETLRITKNLVEDVRLGNENATYAGAVLTGLAAIPASMAYMSEQTLSEKDRADWNKYKDMGAAYSRYNFRIVMGRQPNGDFRYLDFTPLVVHDQLMRMVKGIAAGDTEAVKAANPIIGWENTPALNIFSILTTQRDRYTGEKLYGISGVTSAVWKEGAPTWAGGTEWDRMVRAFTPNAEGGLGIIDQKTGRQSSFSDILINYATSVRPYTLRPAMYQQAALHETQDRLRQQQRVMRRVMQTNRTPEAKEAARQDFIEARNEILMDYRRKLGVQEPQLNLQSGR